MLDETHLAWMQVLNKACKHLEHRIQAKPFDCSIYIRTEPFSKWRKARSWGQASHSCWCTSPPGNSPTTPEVGKQSTVMIEMCPNHNTMNIKWRQRLGLNRPGSILSSLEPCPDMSSWMSQEIKLCLFYKLYFGSCEEMGFLIGSVEAWGYINHRTISKPIFAKKDFLPWFPRVLLWGLT